MKKYLALVLLFLAGTTFAGDVRISAKSTGAATTAPQSKTESSWWTEFCDWVERAF